MRGSPAYLFLSTLMTVVKDAFESKLVISFGRNKNRTQSESTRPRKNRLDFRNSHIDPSHVIDFNLHSEFGDSIENCSRVLTQQIAVSVCPSHSISCRYPNTIIIDEALITIYLQSPRYVRSSTSSRCDDRSLT